MTLIQIAAALAIGLPAIGATIALGNIGKAWLEGISRNPESAKASFVPGILALALSEAVAIYGFVIAFMILGS